MSLTMMSWSLIGAFAGAACGLGMAYPRDPGKFVIGGALAGAMLVGGGSAVLTNDDLKANIGCAFVVCEDAQTRTQATPAPLVR